MKNMEEDISSIMLPTLPSMYRVIQIDDVHKILTDNHTMVVYPNLTCEIQSMNLSYTPLGYYYGVHRCDDSSNKKRGILYNKIEDVYIEGVWSDGILNGNVELVVNKKRYSAIFKNNVMISSELEDPLTEKDRDSDGLPHDDYDSMYRYLRSVTHPQLREFVQYSFNTIYLGEHHPVSQARHGIGSVYKSDGSRFHGTWVYGMIHGFGISVSRKGDIHIGWYKEGKPHSIGSTTIGMDRYVGVFKKGKFHGYGVYYNDKSRTWLLCKFKEGEAIETYEKHQGSGSEHFYVYDDNILLRLFKESGQGIQLNSNKDSVPIPAIVAHDPPFIDGFSLEWSKSFKLRISKDIDFAIESIPPKERKPSPNKLSRISIKALSVASAIHALSILPSIEVKDESYKSEGVTSVSAIDNHVIEYLIEMVDGDSKIYEYPANLEVNLQEKKLEYLVIRPKQLEDNIPLPMDHEDLEYLNQREIYIPNDSQLADNIIDELEPEQRSYHINVTHDELEEHAENERVNKDGYNQNNLNDVNIFRSKLFDSIETETTTFEKTSIANQSPSSWSDKKQRSLESKINNEPISNSENKVEHIEISAHDIQKSSKQQLIDEVLNFSSNDSKYNSDYFYEKCPELFNHPQSDSLECYIVKLPKTIPLLNLALSNSTKPYKF